MKKLIALAVFLLSISYTQAQSAIGARLTNGAEVSFQTPAWGNRLELDAGWNNHYTNINGIYQMVNPLTMGFEWYYGVGGNIGMYSDGNDSDFALGGVGNLGLEYNFKEVPFQISLDWRPTLYIVPGTFFEPGNFGLGLRYKF